MPFANGYTYRRAVTVDHTKVPATLTDFPVYYAGGAYLATVANGGELLDSTNGYDFIFTSDLAGTTPLDYETVVHDLTTGVSEVWVRIPSVSSSVDTVIYLWTANSGVTTDQSNGPGVWDANFGGVWHMPNGSALSLLDSTANANNGTAVNTPTATTGKIDGAGSFVRASSQYVDLGSDPSIKIISSGVGNTSGLTIEAWCKYTGVIGAGMFPRIVSNLASGPFNGFELVVREQTGGSPLSREIYFQTANGGSLYSTLSGITLVQNTIYHVVATFDPGVSPFFNPTSAIFTNGAKSTLNGPIPYNGIGSGGNVRIASSPGLGEYWDGWIDEVRISNVMRSDAWVSATYNNGSSPGTFYSVGSPATSAQTVTPAAAVAGPRAVPSPVVSGGNLTITPAAVGPNRNFANPVVSGPVTVPTVIGPRSIGSPSVTVAQTITLGSAVIGPRNIPTTGRVAHIQVVTLAAAVQGPRAIPVPLVTGGPQYISVYGVRGPRNIAPPAVSGGELATRIYIAGVERTEHLGWQQGQFTIQGQDIGRWRAQFALWQPNGISGYRPQVGETFLVLDQEYRVMAGCITDVVLDRYLCTEDKIWYTCQASDKSAICDHRIVRGKTYPAGSDVVSTILDINANFLNGEGLSMEGVPEVGTLGTLNADLVCNFRNVTSVFDDICNRNGLVWWIDAFVVLYFSPLPVLPAAPFNISEDSNNWRGPGGPEGGGGLTVRWTLASYYNVLYAVSNQTIIPGGGGGGGGGTGAGVTESFVWTPDGPGIATITDSLGARVAVGIITSAVIGSVQNMTVNGAVQTVVDFGAFAGQTPAPPDLLWFWGGPATGNPNNQVGPSVLPTAGAAINITYTAAVTAAASQAQYGEALNPETPAAVPLGTCGSGIYEGVIQVQDISDQGELDAIAAAQLERIGGVPQIVNFQTDYPGLRPGQKINIDVPLSGVDDVDMLITAVNGVMIAPDLGHGGAFRWTVECRSNLDPGNWLKWYERLVNRTANALPIPQFELATFVVPVSSSLSGGVGISNPYIVSRTGKLVDLKVTAAFPPLHSNLVLQLIANNSIVVGTITLPAGSPANTLIVQPADPAVDFYLFADDVLNVTATYQDTGTGTPVRASGLTMVTRWTM